MSHFNLINQVDNIKGKLTDKEYMDLMNTIAEAKKESEKEHKNTGRIVRENLPSVEDISFEISADRIYGTNGLQGPNGWDPMRNRANPNLVATENTNLLPWTPPTNFYTNTTVGNVTYSTQNTTTYSRDTNLYCISAKDILDHSRIIIPAETYFAYLPRGDDLIEYCKHKYGVVLGQLNLVFYSKNPQGVTLCSNTWTTVIGDNYICPNRQSKFRLQFRGNSCELIRD